LYVYPPEAFALICATVLPERFADPPLAKEPTKHPPSSVGKRLAMTDRVHAGKRAFNDADADELPDAVAYQTSKFVGKGLGRRGSCQDDNGQIRLNDELPLVVLQGQQPAPEGPPTLEGCIDPPPFNYEPATELIRAKGDGPCGGEGKRCYSSYSSYGTGVGDE
jgi:hypothetical protein